MFTIYIKHSFFNLCPKFFLICPLSTSLLFVCVLIFILHSFCPSSHSPPSHPHLPRTRKTQSNESRSARQSGNRGGWSRWTGQRKATEEEEEEEHRDIRQQKGLMADKVKCLRRLLSSIDLHYSHEILTEKREGSFPPTLPSGSLPPPTPLWLKNWLHMIIRKQCSVPSALPD